MKVLFDTSVLVAAMSEGHPRHEPSFSWLDRARKGTLAYFVAAHTIAELYAVLCTYPTRPRLAPATAARLVRDNVQTSARVVALSTRDYAQVVQELAEAALAGGVVYDALIARAARKVKADRLLTLNPTDFLRVWPEGRGVVTAP